MKRLVLELTNSCNLTCSYCYRNGLKQENSRPRNPDSFFKAIDRILEQDDACACHIVYFGGEPLLDLPLLKAIGARYTSLERRGSIKGFTLNTNGTCITDEAADYLAETGCSVSIAIDGDQEMHDRCRATSEGKGTHTAVMRGLDRLLHKEVHTAARMTISPENASSLFKGVLYLARNGVKNLGFSPAANMNWEGKDIAAWERSLRQLAGDYAGRRERWPRIFDFEKVSRGEKVICRPGSETVTINAAGGKRPCHRITWKGPEKIVTEHEACRGCEAEYFCTKCVPKYGVERPNHRCELKKALISACNSMKIIPQTRNGDTKMGKYMLIGGELYNVPSEVLEKYRLKDDERRRLVAEGKIPDPKRTEPPLKGNWYELGESDCY